MPGPENNVLPPATKEAHGRPLVRMQFETTPDPTAIYREVLGGRRPNTRRRFVTFRGNTIPDGKTVGSDGRLLPEVASDTFVKPETAFRQGSRARATADVEHVQAQQVTVHSFRDLMEHAHGDPLLVADAIIPSSFVSTDWKRSIGSRGQLRVPLESGARLVIDPSKDGTNREEPRGYLVLPSKAADSKPTIVSLEEASIVREASDMGTKVTLVYPAHERLGSRNTNFLFVELTQENAVYHPHSVPTRELLVPTVTADGQPSESFVAGVSEPYKEAFRLHAAKATRDAERLRRGEIEIPDIRFKAAPEEPSTEAA